MARRFRQLTAAAVVTFASLAASCLAGAAPAPTPSPSTPNPHSSASPPTAPSPATTPKAATPKPQKPDEWEQARRLFEQLSPEQKQKFRENLQQWKSLPPAQQDLFRDLELVRREKIALEIQDAINKSGLHLDEDQREVYALRYTQERRKIENRLHKEMDEKRRSMIAEMLDQLKTEFSPTPSPAK